MSNELQNVLDTAIYYAVKSGVVNKRYAYKLRDRGFIPPKHFTKIVDEAKKDGVCIEFSKLHDLATNHSQNNHPTDTLKNHAEETPKFLHRAPAHHNHLEEETNGTNTNG